jgi:cytoskeletal protein CcmA (bactofilin family)
VKGTITSSGALTVGEHGRIKANITTGSIVIHGHVEGNVTASDRCSLEAGAVLRGDIEAPRLAMDDDSTFMGRAKISSKRS